ncbi:MAG: hypothetical protein ACF8SC_01995 [Phycisphaerales bacterium JB037]
MRCVVSVAGALIVAGFAGVSVAGGSVYDVRVLEQIDFAGASTVQVRGINNAGDIVGYRTIGGVTESFVRTSGGIDFFQVAGADTFALGINDSRDTVGAVSTAGGADSFLRQADGTTVTFQPLGIADTGGSGINNAGVVVGSANPFSTGGFVRNTDGTVTSIDSIGNLGETVLKTNATDINDAGVIFGHALGQAGPDFFGRGWYSVDNGSTFTTVIRPGEQFTYVWAGNDAGLLVGDFSTGFSGDRTGFVFDIASGIFSPFTVTGADWTVPTGINDAGQIVGFSRDRITGQVSGFVAVVPAPGTVVMLAATGLLAGRRRR